MHTSKVKTDNFSMLVSLDIKILKTRCASERYMFFSMQNKNQSLRIILWDHCSSSGPICSLQRATFQLQLRAVLSWVLSTSKDGDPQHFCANSSTFHGNFIFPYMKLELPVLLLCIFTPRNSTVAFKELKIQSFFFKIPHCTDMQYMLVSYKLNTKELLNSWEYPS